ncbi:uncharacterized protein BP5553_05751 [Venustampulla echinocandica]|uniref:Uncharacterized protein n=1 Tax=Venustampulla echinocandica TaxID=2656787 RepID=A0A370TLK7_9HELO|nr:uncharacterized protein BP5553_05751 [Venustampulla echinocandica]RDL36399.1 hypothetical protein BP5553_05751 [Venustampulla echinocandica]
MDSEVVSKPELLAESLINLYPHYMDSLQTPPGPPPPYHRGDFGRPNSRHDESNQFRIHRKPLGAPSDVNPKFREPYGGSVRGASRGAEMKPAPPQQNIEMESRPALPPRPELTLRITPPGQISQSQLYLSPDSMSGRSASTGLRSVSSLNSLRSSAASSVSLETSPARPSSSKSSTSLYVQKAYREARHFAGGLIHHPSESTKHFSILRHSHGLVFYQGNSTTVAVSIFANASMPENRTLWLQSKGWSGKTGMRARQLFGRNGSWLDVTPTMNIKPDQLNPADERAWQRDIASFKKRSSSQIRERHQLRETAVVRIPAEAGDGYFHLVLCVGDKEKVLCTSPVFRLLSVSSNPSCVKGASLSTLPLELGALALSTYTRKVATTMATPVGAVVKNRVEKYLPRWWARGTAAATSSMGGRVGLFVEDANSQYSRQREGCYTSVGGLDLDLEQGPAPPYPIHFTAGYEPGGGREAELSNIPILTLAGVPGYVPQQLHGYYFGWCRFKPNPKTTPVPCDESWHQTIISALPPDASQLIRANLSQANKKILALHIVTEIDESLVQNGSIEVWTMGFLRPDEPSQRANLRAGLEAGDEAAEEAFLVAEVHDISAIQGILDQPAWSPEAAQQRQEEENPAGMDQLKHRYAGMRMAVQRHVDRVPLHKVGVRTEIDRMKDRAVVTNGFCVRR